VVLVLIPVAFTAGACSPPAEERVEEPAEATPAVLPTDSIPVRRVSFAGESAMAYSTPGFEHNPHVDVSCTNCHVSVPGHARHASTPCGECHGATGTGTGATLTKADCQACHHRADPPRDCERCHAAGEMAAPIGVAARLTVAGRTHERGLEFAHSRHSDRLCADCHALPEVMPVRSCASCHEHHHRQDADCTTCHVKPAADSHDLNAHRTCGGSGCHDNVSFLELPLTRPVCLACHTEQRDHEPARECADCHLVRSLAEHDLSILAGRTRIRP
jgi:hypothetical protein